MEPIHKCRMVQEGQLYTSQLMLGKRQSYGDAFWTVGPRLMRRQLSITTSDEANNWTTWVLLASSYWGKQFGWRIVTSDVVQAEPPLLEAAWACKTGTTSLLVE
jgi:hypothetical protein